MLNFTTVRIGVFAVVFLIICLVLRLTKRPNPRRKIRVSFIICAALAIASWFLPVENYIATFPTAEAAFRYNQGIAPAPIVTAVIEGADSAMLIFSNRKDPVIQPKIKTGYGVNGLNTLRYSTISTKLRTNAESDNTFYIELYTGNNTEGTYIIAQGNADSYSLYDNYGSGFVQQSYDYKNWYYKYLDTQNLETYEITIDGEVYTIEDFETSSDILGSFYKGMFEK